MSLLSFFQWLESTQLSVNFHESVWMYPIVESVHVLALCLFLGITVFWDLRLVGVAFGGVPATEIDKRMFPWVKLGFAIMVLSGFGLVLNTPVRYYTNIFFRIKFVMLALAGLNAWVFESGVYKKVKKWDREKLTPSQARMAGAVSLVLWAGIVIAGRMIAYNWFDKR